MQKRSIMQSLLAQATIGGVAAAAVLSAGALSASPNADISVDNGVVHSSKEISNIVIEDCDGGISKIEFKNGVYTFDLADDTNTVWVKAGNAKSGDGAGYGLRFDLDNCGGGDPSLAW